jgi:hypothetical protein
MIKFEKLINLNIKFEKYYIPASQRSPAGRLVSGLPVSELQSHLQKVPESPEGTSPREPGHAQPLQMASSLVSPILWKQRNTFFSQIFSHYNCLFFRFHTCILQPKLLIANFAKHGIALCVSINQCFSTSFMLFSLWNPLPNTISCGTLWSFYANKNVLP